MAHRPPSQARSVLPWPHPGRRRGRWLTAALALHLALAGMAPPPTVADHGGRPLGSLLACDRPVTPPRCTSVGNNLFHHVAFDESLSGPLAEALRRSMAEDYDAPTQLRLIEDARPTALTDVIGYAGDYGDIGAAAWVYCPAGAPRGVSAAGHRWCLGQEMHFNLNRRYAVFFDDTASLDHVTCHELGHTLGLLHWGNPPQTDGPAGATCMNGNTPEGPTSLHGDDIDHINRYAYAVTPSPGRGTEISAVPADPPGAAAIGALVEATGTDQATSLEQLAAGADAVVHGRVVSVEAGPVLGPRSRPLHHATVEIVILRDLARGRVPGGTGERLRLELPLFDGPHALTAVRSAWVGSERILFLREKRSGARVEAPAGSAPTYRLVTFGSELVDVGGRIVAPVDDTALLQRFNGREVGAVVAELAALAR